MLKVWPQFRNLWESVCNLPRTLRGLSHERVSRYHLEDGAQARVLPILNYSRSKLNFPACRYGLRPIDNKYLCSPSSKAVKLMAGLGLRQNGTLTRRLNGHSKKRIE
jgi:hypothetical protein